MATFDTTTENSENPTARKGWDGTVKGGSKMAEQGVYTYKMMVKDTQGNNHPYVGHVTVIKKDNQQKIIDKLSAAKKLAAFFLLNNSLSKIS